VARVYLIDISGYTFRLPKPSRV